MCKMFGIKTWGLVRREVTEQSPLIDNYRFLSIVTYTYVYSYGFKSTYTVLYCIV